MKFSIKGSLSIYSFTFTEEIVNGKLYFLCSDLSWHCRILDLALKSPIATIRKGFLLDYIFEIQFKVFRESYKVAGWEIYKEI